MFRNGHDQLLKVETHYLNVHINCDGCKKKVRKLLKKIDGVYSVQINTEHQLVMVSGHVDSATLIKKLVKSGKRAKLWSPSPKIKQNQEDPSMNQLQFLPTDFSSPQRQFMYPASYKNEIEDMGNFDDYFNQHMAMKAMNARTGQNSIRSVYMDEDNFGGNARFEDDLASIIGRADYQGNRAGLGLGGFDFHGMPTYEQHKHLPSMIMTNKQQMYHYNYPATQMNNIYMQDRHIGSNMMANDFYMYQPFMTDHSSSTYPPYTDYHFHATPYTLTTDQTTRAYADSL